MISCSRAPGPAPLSPPTAAALPRPTLATRVSRRSAADAVAAAAVTTVARLCFPAGPQALARAAGLWELAGAASIVTVMVVIFVAGRARRAYVVGRGRG